MTEFIECRNCDSPQCDGCNIYSLATMLNNGKFDCIMDNKRSINFSADVVEVVRCKDCKHSRTCADNDGEIMCVLNSEYNEDTGVDYGFVSYHSESHYCSYGERRPFK